MIALIAFVTVQHAKPFPIEVETELPSALRARALEFDKLAIKKDIRGLRKLCIKNIECFDIFRLTPVEMRPGTKDSFFDVPVRDPNIGYQVRREVVDLGSLDTFHRKVVQSFCQLIVDSSRVPGYIKIGISNLDEDNVVPFGGKG